MNMLVLSRKEKETLIIGDNITVTVNRVAGRRVTLGIQAPDDIKIVRGEIAEQDARRSAAMLPKVETDQTLVQ